MTRRLHPTAVSALRPAPGSAPIVGVSGARPPVPVPLAGAPALSGMGAGGVVRLTIPGQPVGKGRPRFSNGHAYTPAKTVAAERAIQLLARVAGIKPLTGRLAVRLRFVCETTRGDLDNFAKLVLDALNGIAWADDRQIDDIAALRSFDWANPRTEIEIERIGDDVKRPRTKRALTAGGSR